MLMTTVRRALTGGAVTLTAALAAPAAAQNVIDQQQPIFNGDPFIGAQYWSAQTFTPRASNVSGAGAFLQPYGTRPSGSFTVALWSGNPSIGASRELASQIISVSLDPSTQGAWADAFWSPVAVTPGQTYWLLIGGAVSTNFQTTTGTSPSNYANGGAYATGTDIRGTYLDYTSRYDLVFRTYTSVGVTVTPEPATWALLGAGLLTIGGVATRRKHRVSVQAARGR